MAIGTEVLDQGGSATPPPRSLVVSRARTSRRIRIDRWASRLVIVGGITIIAAILAILFVIAAEVAPLWRSPSATLLGAASTGASPAPGEGAGVNEYRELAYEVTATGQVAFASLVDKGAPAPVAVPALEGATVTAVDETNPPTMTTAIGCSISCPGFVPLTTSGNRAIAVTSAVIAMGSRRSCAPRITSSRPNGTPSSRSRCL